MENPLLRSFSRSRDAASFGAVLFVIVGAFAFTVQAQSMGIRQNGGSRFIYIVKTDGSISRFGNEESDGAMR